MAVRPEKTSDLEVPICVRDVQEEVAEERPVIQKSAGKRLAELYDEVMVNWQWIGWAYAWWITVAGYRFIDGADGT